MYIPRIWDTSIEHTYNTIYIIYTTTPHQLTEGGCHPLLFVFAHGPRAAEARWGTAAKAR
jgi:hypothetical protein